MKTRLRILCIACMIIFLLAACTETPAPQVTEPTPAAEAAATPLKPDEPDNVVIEVTVPTQEPVAAPTEAPTPEPTATPEPTPTPAPTRAPRAGDIAVNFPDYDTGVDADYSYQSDELRIAITVHREQMSDGRGRNLNEVYYVADIWVRNLDSFRTAFAKNEFRKGVEDGDALARRENAVLAVNGSYIQGLVLSSGKLYQKQRAIKGWNSGSACILYKDGSMKTFKLKKEKVNVDQELKKGAWHGWQFGPIVIRDGEAGPNATAYGDLGFKARNILGYYEPGHYVIVNCDAYRDDAQGMNAQMMVDVMKSLGVKEAFNLDGGVSAVMVFMGEIINRPTPRYENGKKEEGRAIFDMLLFGEYDENGVSPDLSTLTADKFSGRN